MVYLLTGVGATGAGDGYQVGNRTTIKFLQKYSVQFDWTITALESITALTVDIEGSIDGANYETLASHVADADQITAKHGMFHVVNKPVEWVRANITTLTKSGGTAVINIKFSPTWYKEL